MSDHSDEYHKLCQKLRQLKQAKILTETSVAGQTTRVRVVMGDATVSDWEGFVHDVEGVIERKTEPLRSEISRIETALAVLNELY